MTVAELTQLAAFLGAGLCMGFGAIGSAVGEGFAAGRTCEAVSRQPGAAGSIMRTMFIGMAIAESPAIFALVVTFLLLFNPAPAPRFIHAACYLGAGVCMGLGVLGPGTGEGYVASCACASIGREPGSIGLTTRTMIIAQAISESTAIYSLVIALLLIYAVPG